jgi:hypothetical protein
MWLGSLFTGDYDTKIAKEAFGKIKNQAAFMKFALAYIASPEEGDNVASNVKHLLKFCQVGDKSLNKLVVEGFSAIPEAKGKSRVFDALMANSSGFNPGKLEPAEAKTFAKALVKAEGGPQIGTVGQ